MSAPYRWLAQYYDEFFEPLRPPIDLARRHLLKRLLPKVKSACDLACGSGTTALDLAKQGIKVYAVDLSPLMCRLARAKTTGLPVKVLRADMRKFVLPEAVDLIISECDAINHIPRKSDLRAVVRSAAKALKPGGHFFFDINNSLGFTTYWTGLHYAERPGIVMVMNNDHNRRADRAWSDIDWFVRNPDGKTWTRHQEHVDEVCWVEGEIRDTLTAAGFDDVQLWDASPYFKQTDPRVTPGCRSIYLARKALT